MDLRQILDRIPDTAINSITSPLYTAKFDSGPRLGLAVESMKRHTTDEGWQIFAGLEKAGYKLCGKRLPINEIDVTKLLAFNPSVVVVQDKREWDVAPKDFRDKEARFINIQALKHRDEIFKLTILKDAHQRRGYHQESAEEMDVNAWIIYYHPEIVYKLAPYIRPQHLIRVYHTLNKDLVPRFSIERKGCLLSGAISDAYPLRKILTKGISRLAGTLYLRHPGYHMNGCATPKFLQLLNLHKVAICTASVYGYALRKIIEATACGCIVVTDLPKEEVLPEIDNNLIRVSSTITVESMRQLLLDLYCSYNHDKQIAFAEKAKEYYDYRVAGIRLAQDIERMRINYGINQ